ncbi:MAG: lipoyl synthase [Candidatus Omnitrophota bacterium]
MKKTALKRNQLPDWFRQNIPDAKSLAEFRSLKKQGVNTVCREARCPNWPYCISRKTLTFMILGDRCTRNCRFCAVRKQKTEIPPLDKDEPYRILKIIKEFQLNYVIITSVSRDDLDDCGANQFIRTISLIRDYNKDIKIEVLIPDFIGSVLQGVVGAKPDVLAHNLETVPRLYPRMRKEASYSRSLRVIAESKELDPDLITKSSLLLGMSEKKEEVFGVMDDLLGVGCDILVLGQYLSPGLGQSPVREYIALEQFQEYQDAGLKKGFRQVLAFPLARTSYQAQEIYQQLKFCG